MPTFHFSYTYRAASQTSPDSPHGQFRNHSIPFSLRRTTSSTSATSTCSTHHTPLGPNRNQFGVTSSDSATGLDAIIVNNWPIYDGAGPNAAIVARAQGMHVYAGNWNNVFSIVFEIQRYIQKHLYVRSI